MSKYSKDDTDLGRIIERMDARIRALESENRASFTSVDSEAFVTREGSFRVLDAAGNVAGELGKMANGEYGLAFKDGSGNSIVKLGKSIADGLYSFRVLDGTGAIKVRAGELGSGEYGLTTHRPNGSIIMKTATDSLGSSILSFVDVDSNEVLKLTDSQYGLIRPHIPLTFITFAALTNPTQSTTSGTFAVLWNIMLEIQQKNAELLLHVKNDAGTSGELLITGQVIPYGSGADEFPILTLLDLSPTYGNQIITIEISARRTGGTGAVRVEVLYAAGRGD